MTLTPIQERALREIYAWGSHYPLRPEIMPTLAKKHMVRRMYGMWLGFDYWEITEAGKAWVRNADA